MGILVMIELMIKWAINTAQKMKFPIKDLVTFTEAINGKLHFLCSRFFKLDFLCKSRFFKRYIANGRRNIKSKTKKRFFKNKGYIQ